MTQSRPILYISKAVLRKSAAELHFHPGEIIVVTGPNNSGKSTLLKDLRQHLTQEGPGGNYKPRIVEKISTETSLSKAEMADVIISRSDKHDSSSSYYYFGRYYKYKASYIRSCSARHVFPKSIVKKFVSYFSTKSRLSMSGRDDYRYPDEDAYSLMYLNEPAEIEASRYIKAAFGKDLILNRTDIKKSTFHVGNRDTLPSHQERLTPSAKAFYSELPEIQQQGDGIQSFSGIITYLIGEEAEIVLIDEPEAFLHPPQVRLLAQFLARHVRPTTQMFIATHSVEFLRSILDFGAPRVSVLRFDGSRDIPRRLVSSEIRSLWKDPLLRTSEALSALFHEVAVICEGDSDVRFFRAMLDELREDARIPDVQFYHVGGKDRIPSIVSAIRVIGVHCISVVDIDVLSDTTKFMKLYNAHGGKDEDLVAGRVKQLNRLVNEKKSSVSDHHFKIILESEYKEFISGNTTRKDFNKRLKEIDEQNSPWNQIKKGGRTGLMDHSTISIFDEISSYALDAGILINDQGELEGFCRTISTTKKSQWLHDVLQLDLRQNDHLEAARGFVQKLIRKTNELNTTTSPTVPSPSSPPPSPPP